MVGDKVFCIFNKAIGGGVTVLRSQEGRPLTFPTREQAEQEIAQSVVARIFQAFAGGDSEDSELGTLSVRDYVREVEVLEGGVLQDAEGNQWL